MSKEEDKDKEKEHIKVNPIEITQFDKPFNNVVTIMEFDFINRYYYENDSKDYAYLKKIPEDAPLHVGKVNLRLCSKELLLDIVEVSGGIILRFLIEDEKPLYLKNIFIELPSHLYPSEKFFDEILG